MKKKNGFTITELLGVIAILALLATVATPAIISLSKRINENIYKAKVKLIEESAIMYAEKNNVWNNYKISLAKLCEEGFITPDKGLSLTDCLENPKNKETMGKCMIRITKSNGRYTAKVTNELLNGGTSTTICY